MIEELKLMKQTKKGTWVRSPAMIERADGRILFLKSEFAIKDEIKAMQGSKWHGHIDGDGRRIWSVADSVRNNFQLSFMQGGNPYEPWDKPLQNWDYSRPLYDHQKLMADHCLTYHYKLLAAEMGVGKSLAAIEIMEHVNPSEIWYVAPKSGIAAVEREFSKWGLSCTPTLMTYDRLRIDMERWGGGASPQMVFFDESQRLKNARSKRTKAAQHLADAIRLEWGWDGYVILMSGSPAPKSPVDWWAQCEICYPGYLREGSEKAFEWRMAIFEKQMTDQGKFFKRKTWRDNPEKCDTCGEMACHENHDPDDAFSGGASHIWVPSKNEVSYLHERTGGLVLTLMKKDCLDLPEMQFREIYLKPNSTIKRVAKALVNSATTAIQGLTWLRELSDGFQYRKVQDGVRPCKVCDGKGECDQWVETDEGTEKVFASCHICEGTGNVPHIVRETKKLKCPKEDAVRDLLDENEDVGRLVVFAGFIGSVDRVVEVCHRQHWDVVRVDSRGWKVLRHDGTPDRTKALDYWADLENNERVVFVANPESGGVGLTLTEAWMAVFYSNDFKPESRIQAMGRIHRPGMDENRGATIVDLLHLGTDKKVLDVLKDNRRLETLSLGDVKDAL